MAILILGTWIFNAPKDLPKDVFNITVNNETQYFTTVQRGDCARHIETARQTLLLTYSLLEVQEMLAEEFIVIQCIKQEVTPPIE